MACFVFSRSVSSCPLPKLDVRKLETVIHWEKAIRSSFVVYAAVLLMWKCSPGSDTPPLLLTSLVEALAVAAAVAIYYSQQLPDFLLWFFRAASDSAGGKTQLWTQAMWILYDALISVDQCEAFGYWLKWAGWGAIRLQQPKWLAPPFICLGRINAVSLVQHGGVTAAWSAVPTLTTCTNSPLVDAMMCHLWRLL